MKFYKYIKDSIQVLLISLLLDLIFSFIWILDGLTKEQLIFLIINNSFVVIFYISISFYQKNKNIKTYQKVLAKLDEKYLIYDVLKDEINEEQKIIFEMVNAVLKEEYSKRQEEKNKLKLYQDFITIWVHEMKQPLFLLENSKDLTFEMNNQLSQMKNLLEKILYYEKIDTLNIDTYITNYNLKDIVDELIVKYSPQLIYNKFKIIVDVKDIEINIDKKYFQIGIQQIIENALKYNNQKDNFLKMVAQEEGDTINFLIINNGLKIDNREYKEIFNKGYVGRNAKNNEKSSGFGLFLSEKILNKMNCNIKLLYSNQEETVFEIKIPKFNNED